MVKNHKRISLFFFSFIMCIFSLLNTNCLGYQRQLITILPLPNIASLHTKSGEMVDLIIFSYKRPMQLYALLESLQEFVTHLNRVFILYRADDDRYERAYKEIAHHFPTVTFIKQSVIYPTHDFRPILLSLVGSSSGDYIMFATDDNIVKDYVDLQLCTKALKQVQAYHFCFDPNNQSIHNVERIKAYGFYLRLGKNIHSCYPLQSQQAIPPLTPLGNELYAWHIDPYEGSLMYDWEYPNTVDMTIYPKYSIIDILQEISFTNPNSLEGNWAQQSQRGGPKIGICFEQSKIVNIPVNRVQNVAYNKSMECDPLELLALFENGFKIDRKPFYKWQNQAAHSEAIFEFIQR